MGIGTVDNIQTLANAPFTVPPGKTVNVTGDLTIPTRAGVLWATVTLDAELLAAVDIAFAGQSGTIAAGARSITLGLSSGIPATAGVSVTAPAGYPVSGVAQVQSLLVADTRSPIASIGGSGVDTLGREIATLDSTGAVRNVLDDGNGNLIPHGSALFQGAGFQNASDAIVVTGNTRFAMVWYTIASISMRNNPSGITLSTGGRNVTISNGVISGDPPQTTLTGSTAGSIVWSMPFQGSSYKKFVAWFDGYENDTATPQTISYPAAFAEVPAVSNLGGPGGVTTTTTELSIDPDNTIAYTGWIVVEGY